PATSMQRVSGAPCPCEGAHFSPMPRRADGQCGRRARGVLHHEFEPSSNSNGSARRASTSRTKLPHLVRVFARALLCSRTRSAGTLCALNEPFVWTVFALVYLGMLLGRLPGLALDRTGVALLGAIVLVAGGALSLDEAWLAIDVPTLALL